MYRSANLSSEHYASRWPVANATTLNDRVTVNLLAIEYANLDDGPEKEALCLELVRCFNTYLRKHLNMITRGHLPSLRTPAGKDATKLLRTMIPRSKKISRETLLAACRTLHLAFKQQSTDDIYDILVMCLMRAVRKYDPHYTSKVQMVVETIDEIDQEPGSTPSFTESDITQAVGFNATGPLRLLVKRGHLASIAGIKKKVIGYRRTTNWPPDRSFLESGPVGFVYFLPMYFRWYLHEYITTTMSAIESKEGMLQLDHRARLARSDGRPGNFKDLGLPHAEGGLTDRDGTTWAADTTLMHLPMDVGELTLDWVKGTPDKLFRKLTVGERYLLYLVYVKEYKWIEIAAVLDCDTNTVRKQYEQVMMYLQARARRQEPHESLPTADPRYSDGS